MNPRFSVHTADKTSPRSFSWIWFLRIAQIVVSLIVLGLSATNIQGLSSSGCSVPGKMAWNLACAVLALIVLAYLLFSSGVARIFRILPWWIFIQLGLDALMFIFWLAAGSTSRFTCFDLCSTCNAFLDIEITYDSLDCFCNSNDYIFYEKRGISANPNFGGIGGVLEKRRTYRSGAARSAARSTGTLVAREALDAIMVILFFITLCATAWWMWQNRKAGSNTTAAPATSTNPNPENGVQQVPMEMKQDTPYTGAPTQQYNNGNAPPQYNNGAPMSPQGQYPPQQQNYPQQPQQAYGQQQSYPLQPQQPYGQQQQQAYPPTQQGYQNNSYPEQPPQGQGYFGGTEGQQQREVSSPPMQSPVQPTSAPHQGQGEIPNYPTPTPEMQAEHEAPRPQ